MDDHLKEYADKYERWREKGDFTYSSKIIPVQESFAASQWVLPTRQVLQILENAKSFALTDCRCRAHYGRCDKPRDVCFLIDEYSDKAVQKNRARRISLPDAEEVLRKADRHGLVHLTLYMPGHRIYALCSCCSCCCHDLRLLKEFDRRDLVTRSDYIAVTDLERCTECGKCVDRCMFEARKLQNGIFSYDPGACLGCGLCVSVCPAEATEMRRR
ncbi:MAG TPA: 4Fe-4S binding protein [Methanoregulaceae archaeon]|nr:4Fe-4S binding protein [Methanoregulaceae archaeon]